MYPALQFRGVRAATRSPVPCFGSSSPTQYGFQRGLLFLFMLKARRMVKVFFFGGDVQIPCLS